MLVDVSAMVKNSEKKTERFEEKIKEFFGSSKNYF